MAADTKRTVEDDISDAIKQLDEAIVEAQRMRDHLLTARRALGDDQRGVLRQARRSGGIAAAAVESARDLVSRAQSGGS